MKIALLKLAGVYVTGRESVGSMAMTFAVFDVSGVRRISLRRIKESAMKRWLSEDLNFDDDRSGL